MHWPARYSIPSVGSRVNSPVVLEFLAPAVTEQLRAMWLGVNTCGVGLAAFSHAKEKTMPKPETVLIFMATALALNVTPGPSILYILSRSLGHGRTAGVVSALGLGVGSLIHAGAAALGLSVIIAYSPPVYLAVKYLGAAYLVYMGVRLLIRHDPQSSDTVSAPMPLRQMFWQGVITEVLNPKIVVFFLSFLPQFVDPASGSVVGQTLCFGLLFHVTGLPVNLLVALAGGAVGSWFARHTLFERCRNGLAGAVLIGLGVRLALSERR